MSYFLEVQKNYLSEKKCHPFSSKWSQLICKNKISTTQKIKKKASFKGRNKQHKNDESVEIFNLSSCHGLPFKFIRSFELSSCTD
jgi:hypothetical protein